MKGNTKLYAQSLRPVLRPCFSTASCVLNCYMPGRAPAPCRSAGTKTQLLGCTYQVSNICAASYHSLASEISGAARLV